MAAYRRVYDSRHLQADWQEPESAPMAVIEYRLPFYVPDISWEADAFGLYVRQAQPIARSRGVTPR